MDTALIMGAFVGFVMLVVGLAVIIPELAIDSPLELLCSFITNSWDRNFFSLVHTHIREGWPETRIAAVLYYGGLSLLASAALAYWLQPYFAQLVFTPNTALEPTRRSAPGWPRVSGFGCAFGPRGSTWER